MPRFLTFILLTMLATANAIGAPAAQITPLVYVLRSPDGHWTKVQIKPKPDGLVEIGYSNGQGTQNSPLLRKTFDPPVLDSLRKIWGAPGFDIHAIKTDSVCGHGVTWWLKAGADRRRICQGSALVDKLNDLQSMIQLLMR